ncbi:hypothetical protein RJ641_002741 [Dillenia turbinata]|uniref:Uncharacterized protein n=1 Tax=Dillenia turbinata TaxID=194707 RepID=A0AAN8ZEM9_9MAGN
MNEPHPIFMGSPYGLWVCESRSEEKEEKKMGLSNFPSPAEGVLPVLVMNTVLSVALLKNMIKSLLQVMGAIGDSSYLEEDPSSGEAVSSSSGARERRISITQFKSLCNNKSSICRTSSCGSMEECVVCLCGFESDEEINPLKEESSQRLFLLPCGFVLATHHSLGLSGGGKSGRFCSKVAFHLLELGFMKSLPPESKVPCSFRTLKKRFDSEINE